MKNYMVPVTIEKTADGERSLDIYSRLLKDRVVFLNGEVEDGVAGAIIAQFLFLEADKKGEEIWFYINSPGGSVTAGFAIYDALSYITSPINTVCIGQAASMGAFLLCMGDKGRRHATPNSRIMVHQVSGGAQGTAMDMRIQLKEAERLYEMILEKMASRTGKTIEQLRKDCERDNFMGAEEALAYGLIDKVIELGKK